MAYPVTEWRAEHLDFLRVLNMLERQVAAAQSGALPNCGQIRNILHYLREFPELIHHPREEAAFSRLVQRRPEFQPMADRLLQEHQAMAEAGRDLLNRLEQAAGDIASLRGTMESAVVAYIAFYRSHIAAEELEFIPLADQFMDPRDWAAMAAAVPVEVDPLFGDKVGRRFRELRRQIELAA